ncbi:MAG: transglycosylase SLT domain-containing protein [Bacteroides sp.]|nr:transglycosylase SLT domain-containing protein [Bacteroides sp.]
MAIFQDEQTAQYENWDLEDVQMCGELIVLTVYGPVSYFEFHGLCWGHQYMLANEYAKSIGVGIRVDVSRSQKELIEKLENGEGDVIAYNLGVSDSLKEKLTYCGEKEFTSFLDSLSKVRGIGSFSSSDSMAWAVRKQSGKLARSLSAWISENRQNFGNMTTVAVSDKGGHEKLSHRNVYAPALNLSKGKISVYDGIFKRASAVCGWDWRLLAAQAYQESAFDSEAVSWMGAKGLMQIMPATARYLGISENDIFNPEVNVRGAVKLIKDLDLHYADIKEEKERIKFVLAAYNAGAGHIDDARALASKYGKNPDCWEHNVDKYVLLMSCSEYYNDMQVQYGYFRGEETYNYVYGIMERWKKYRRGK